MTKNINRFTVASFFSGAGGLDQGFSGAGFQTVWANEFDKQIAHTFKLNHQETEVVVKSISEVAPEDVPEVDGFIGGPPCQSWSQAGAKRGINDPRGQLFHDYIRLIAAKKPTFFVAENVTGILAPRNQEALGEILKAFCESGYNVSYGTLNAADYGVAQDRKRVVFVGYRAEISRWFQRPQPLSKKVSLREILAEIPSELAIPVTNNLSSSPLEPSIANHHYWDGAHFSSIYMSRNRVRGLDAQSFTIQASASHAPLHPKCSPMIKVEQDLYRFDENSEYPYRRLSVRECAKIQGFPDEYVFEYNAINTGYKMVGNAVPVQLAEHIAISISNDLSQFKSITTKEKLIGTARKF